MSCASCQKQKNMNPGVTSGPFPFESNDISVVDQGQVRGFESADWPDGKHKLLVLFPESFTPVCRSELGAINEWTTAFAELNCLVIAVCSDPVLVLQDWYKQEPLLQDLNCRTFSSYLLPARLGLVENGRAKRASVFIMDDGTIVKQEHFHKVGRSFAELHRMLYGYTTDSYCAEGWTSPADGFLETAE